MGFRLQSVDISGFKSFGRPVRLEIARGLTGLVGPNGSGKSNVVEAIRWCLGEQSARDLRSARAVDVIHAGRKRVLGMAEVTLAFEPGEGSSDADREFLVARRLDRSGESEYLLDGRRVRLRDVHDALKRADIEAGRTVVVNQGMADAWLSATPIERRVLIEQAAGIGHYRDQRDEARQKLAQTQQNILVLENLLEEIVPRARMLRRQARAVVEREEARRHLHSRLLQWYSFRWNTLTREHAEARRQVEGAASRHSDVASRLHRAETEFNAVVRRHEEWQSRVNDLFGRRHVLREEQQRIDARRHRLEQDVEGLERQQDDMGSLLERAGTSVDDASRRRADQQQLRFETEGEVAALRPRVTELELRNGELHRQIEDQTAVLSEMVAQLREREQVQQSLARDAVDLETRARSASVRSAEALTRVEAFVRESALIESNVEAGERAVRVHEESYGRLCESLRRARDNRRAVDDVLERVGTAARQCAVAQSSAARRHSLVARQIETATGSTGHSLIETLDVPPGLERAIASALGSWAFVDVQAARGTLLRTADMNEIKRWRDGLVQCGTTGCTWADELAPGAPVDRANPLITTLIARSAAEAERVWASVASAPALRCSTPPLQVIDPEGRVHTAVGVHESPEVGRAHVLLEQRREAREANERALTLEKRLVRLQDMQARVQVEKEHVDVLVEQLDGEEHEAAQELRQARAKLSGLQRNRTVNNDNIEASHREVERLRDEESEHRRRIEQIGAQLVGVQQELDALRADIASTEAAHGAAKAELGEVRMQADHARSTLKFLNRRLTEVQAQENVLDVEVVRHSEVITDLVNRQHSLHERLSATRLELHRLGEVDVSPETALREVAAEIEKVQAAEPKLDVDLNQITALRSSLTSCITEHEQAAARAAHLAEERVVLTEELMTDVGISPAELPPSPAEPPADSEIRRLRGRVNQYFEADEAVIEEYEHLDARRVALERNVAELRQAVCDLTDVMAVADREMNRRFERAFRAVNEEFARVFRIMLRGGDARLEMLGENGGIEILAQLPGKRLRESAAFSGGERALIASALLFGVLNIRPTPFCVLDEVDAALDESNVDRFLEVLRNVSQSTQIIVVTHNRATMAACDVLYGMTMDADGVSTMLSLRLENYATA